MSRGGFIINRLVGIACEAIGRIPLIKLVPKLNPQEARRVLAELDKLDSTRFTWEEVRRNEDSFHRHQLRNGFNPITWLIERWQGRQVIQFAEKIHNRVILPTSAC